MNVVEMSKLANTKFLKFVYNGSMDSNILEVSYRWNLATMFKDSVEWGLEFTSIEDIYPHYANFQGTLTESGSNLLQYLEFDNSYCARFDKLRLYSRLRLLQDPYDDEAQQQQAKLDELW
jgi:oligoendopeptidase F